VRVACTFRNNWRLPIGLRGEGTLSMRMKNGRANGCTACLRCGLGGGASESGAGGGGGGGEEIGRGRDDERGGEERRIMHVSR
jgi:hypothetical protein